VPDGRGVTYRNSYVAEGAQVLLDDDLVLHMIKQLYRTRPLLSCGKGSRKWSMVIDHVMFKGFLNFGIFGKTLMQDP
jgi:hypothetical protein